MGCLKLNAPKSVYFSSKGGGSGEGSNTEIKLWISIWILVLIPKRLDDKGECIEGRRFGRLLQFLPFDARNVLELERHRDNL